MNSRTTATVFLLIVLVITWILMSSITPLIIKTSGSKSNNLVNIVSVSKSQIPGIGLGTGLFGAGFGINGFGIGLFGSGFGFSGVGFGLHGLGEFIALTMPFINEPVISPLPPKIHITQPVLPLTFSNMPIISPVFSWSITNTTMQHHGGGGGGGSGGGVASGVHGVNSMNNEVVKTTVIKIVLPWLLWVLIAIIIILLIFTIISARSSLVRLRLLSEKSERRVERKPKVKAEMPRPKPMEKPQQALPRMELPINGLPTPLRGWGGGKFVDLGIDKDLPLTWRINDPLPFTVSNGASLELHPEGEVIDNTLVFRNPGCHEVRARVNGNVAEVHRILVVEDYDGDVMNVFRANMAMHGLEDIENKTPREICMELASKGLVSETNCEYWVSLRIFEAVRYGHVGVDRRAYEDFIRGLTRLRDALVMGCPG